MTLPASSLEQTKPWLGPLMLLGGGICIGFAPIGLRLGLDDLGPQGIAFWRYVFAAPILFILVLGVERRLPGPPSAAIFVAGTCFALDIGLWHAALTYTTVANATFIVNLGNIGVGFLAWLVLKEKPTLIWGIAVLIAVIGAAALSLGGGVDAKGDIRGDLMALGAAFLVSGYMLFSKIARGRMGALEVIFWLTVVEAVVGGIVTLVMGEQIFPAQLSGFLVPLGLALLVQVGGQGLIIAGLGRTPAAIAGIIVLIQPVVAAAISWQLFDEPLSVLQGGGAALILFGIFLSQKRQRSTRTVKTS